MLTTFAIGMPQGFEWIIILVVALLIFGKRLPEVGKSIGKTIVEFKKGMQGLSTEAQSINRQIEAAANEPAPTALPAKEPQTHQQS